MNPETIVTFICAFGGSLFISVMTIGSYKHKIDNHEQCIKKHGEDLEGGLRSVRDQISSLDDRVVQCESDSRLIASALEHNTRAIEENTKMTARLTRGFIRLTTREKERDRERERNRTAARPQPQIP